MKLFRISIIVLLFIALGYSVQKARIAKDAYGKVCESIGEVRNESFRAVTAEDEAIKTLLETAPPQARQLYADQSAAASIAKGNLKHHEDMQIKTMATMLVYIGGGFVYCVLIYLFRFRKKN